MHEGFMAAGSGQLAEVSRELTDPDRVGLTPVLRLFPVRLLDMRVGSMACHARREYVYLN